MSSFLRHIGGRTTTGTVLLPMECVHYVSIFGIKLSGVHPHEPMCSQCGLLLMVKNACRICFEKNICLCKIPDAECVVLACSKLSIHCQRYYPPLFLAFPICGVPNHLEGGIWALTRREFVLSLTREGAVHLSAGTGLLSILTLLIGPMQSQEHTGC